MLLLITGHGASSGQLVWHHVREFEHTLHQLLLDLFGVQDGAGAATTGSLIHFAGVECVLLYETVGCLARLFGDR